MVVSSQEFVETTPNQIQINDSQISQLYHYLNYLKRKLLLGVFLKEQEFKYIKENLLQEISRKNDLKDLYLQQIDKSASYQQLLEEYETFLKEYLSKVGKKLQIIDSLIS
jgi:ferric iron reductase protein FhuF